MSFLGNPRLTFSGLFQADPSTVNNDPRHFDNQQFEPGFQEVSSKNALNGWWNPMGTAVFRFSGCKVGAAFGKKGELSGDPVIGFQVGNSPDKSSAKLVDIDPDWQLASQIYGQQVTLIDPKTQKIVLLADFEPAPFRDLWFSRNPSQGDAAASAMWQTLLCNLQWNLDGVDSKLLHALAEGSLEGALSIRIATFSYQQTMSDPRFTYGRVLGAIGLQKAGAPKTFVAGRRFMPLNNSASSLGLTCFSSEIDADAGTLTLDLSNALPLTLENTLVPIDGLQAVVLLAKDAGEGVELTAKDYAVIGPVAVPSEDDFSKYAGITVLNVVPDVLKQAADHPIALVRPAEKTSPPDNVVVEIRENAAGLEVRTDNVSFRLDPNDPEQNRATARMYATQYGRPLPDAKLTLLPVAPAPDLGDAPASTDPIATPRAAIPFTNTPLGAITFSPEEPVTGADGTVDITFQGPATFGTPRSYMDGQLYNFAYNFREAPGTVLQTFDQYSILVFSSFSVKEPVAWEDVQPILQQYANLYPIMSEGLFDFSKREVADRNAHLLHFVFSRDLNDPNYMPVTRDLSAGKRAALLSYFGGALAASADRAPEIQARYASRCPFSGVGQQRKLEDADISLVPSKGGRFSKAQ